MGIVSALLARSTHEGLMAISREKHIRAEEIA